MRPPRTDSLRQKSVRAGAARDIVSAVDDDQTGNGDESRDLTLSERVAWVNAFERSLRREDGSFVLELTVYPLVGDEELPAPAFTRTLSHRVRKFVSGSS